MTTKFYSTKANAKRALKVALAKIDLTPEDVAFQIDGEDGQYFVHLTFDAAEVPDGIETLEGFNVELVGEDAPAPAKKSAYIREVSDHGGVCAEVWGICDEMQAEADEAGEKLSRKAVIEACRQQGIAFGTARTQYQKWKTKRGA
jgi:hypothetical protein